MEIEKNFKVKMEIPSNAQGVIYWPFANNSSLEKNNLNL